jgi:hypothetical protein
VARRDTAAGAYVFAAPARPRDDNAALYRCPAYNVFLVRSVPSKSAA